MQTYCVSCKKTGNNNAKAINTKNGRLMLKSICTVCEKKKSRFISRSWFVIKFRY